MEANECRSDYANFHGLLGIIFVHRLALELSLEKGKDRVKSQFEPKLMDSNL